MTVAEPVFTMLRSAVLLVGHVICVPTELELLMAFGSVMADVTLAVLVTANGVQVPTDASAFALSEIVTDVPDGIAVIAHVARLPFKVHAPPTMAGENAAERRVTPVGK